MIVRVVNIALVACLALSVPAPSLAARKEKRYAPVAHARTTPRLANNRWRPVRIGYENVIVLEGQHEPWIQLDPRQKHVTGSGGCNRITGSYQSADSTLRFGPLNTTKMACPTMQTETKFLRALAATRRYRISGSMLELMDARGEPLARLEERNPR
ncbi:MAG TPA: META domain-containing protein [Candidatus Eisenbacteria bacterium]|jgi:heat shock protein HslJ